MATVKKNIFYSVLLTTYPDPFLAVIAGQSLLWHDKNIQYHVYALLSTETEWRRIGN